MLCTKITRVNFTSDPASALIFRKCAVCIVAEALFLQHTFDKWNFADKEKVRRHANPSQTSRQKFALKNL